MTKQNTRTTATRLSLSELAKARDGLLKKGISEQDLSTTSQILRLCVYFMILECDEPKADPTEESMDFIRQLWNQTKMTKNISVEDIINQ